MTKYSELFGSSGTVVGLSTIQGSGLECLQFRGLD